MKINIYLTVIFFQAIVTFAASQNDSLQTLTDKDYQTIKGIDAGIASVAVPSSVDDSLNCRLVHECKICHQEVHTIEEDIYSDECDINNHVKNCRKLTRIEPFEKRIKICHHVVEKACDAPCNNCPEFCQPNKQFWCEDNFTISSEVEVHNKIHKVVEKLVPTRGCFEKTLDPLCTTLNCKFVTKSRECMDTLKTIMVNLTTEECEVCQPIDRVEKFESSTTCVTSEERNCPTGSEPRWVKKCTRKFNKFSSREPRGDEDILNEVIPLHDLFQMAAKPVRDLLYSKTQNQTGNSNDLPTTDRPVLTVTKSNPPIDMTHLMVLNDRGVVNSGSHLVASHARKPHSREGFFFTSNSKPEGKLPSSDHVRQRYGGDELTTVSEYFDPIYNVHVVATTEEKATKSQDDFKKNGGSTIEYLETSKLSTTKSTTIVIVEPLTVPTTTIKTTTSTTTASTTTTTAQSTTTSDQTTLTLPTSSTATSTTLVYEENQTPNSSVNEIEASGSPFISTTTIPETVRTVRISVKEQARLCLFHGVCDDGDLQRFMKNSKILQGEGPEIKTSTTTLRPTTTSKPPKAKLVRQPSDFAIIAQIQRCIQTPEFCNTNLIRSGGRESSSTILTPTEPTQRTTIKPETTLPTFNDLTNARNCVLNGNCGDVRPRSSRLHNEPEEARVIGLRPHPEQARSSGHKEQTNQDLDLTTRVRLCLFSQICK